MDLHKLVQARVDVHGYALPLVSQYNFAKLMVTIVQCKTDIGSIEGNILFQFCAMLPQSPSEIALEMLYWISRKYAEASK